jgi:hypothetical protein
VARAEHANANEVDDVPDAVEMTLFRHTLITASGIAKFLQTRRSTSIRLIWTMALRCAPQFETIGNNTLVTPLP